MPDMENLAASNCSDVLCFEGDYRESGSPPRNEFYLERAPAFVDVDDCAHVTGLETVIGECPSQDYHIVFIHCDVPPDRR